EDRKQRIAERLCKLQGPASEIIGKTRKRIRSEKIILLFRMVHSVEALETGLYRPLRARIHEQVADFGIPVVTLIVVLPASAVERIKNIDRLSSQPRRGLRKIFPVFVSDLMHERLRQNRGLSYLKFRIADDVVGSVIGQRCRAPEKLIQPLLMLILVIDVQRVVFVDRKLAAGIEVFVPVGGHNGRGK